MLLGVLGLEGCGRSDIDSPTTVADRGAVATSNVAATAPRLESAGGGCEAVSGTLSEAGLIFQPIPGTIAGDLEGSTSVSHDLSRYRQTGNINFAGHNYGERTWQISAGALAGRTLQLTFQAIATNPRPGFQILGDWHETAKVVAGARSGNLTLNGTINAPNGPPGFVFELRYHGQICP